MGWMDAHLTCPKIARYAEKFQPWEEQASEGTKSTCTTRKMTPEELARLDALFAKDAMHRKNWRKH